MDSFLPDAKKMTFTMSTLETGTLPAFSGHILRGILLTYFEQHDPVLISLLHEENEQRPYAIKDLRVLQFDPKRKSRRTGAYKILKGELFKFELIVIGSDITERSLKSIINENQPTLYLNQLPIRIYQIELATIPLIYKIDKATGKYYLRFLTPMQFLTLEDNIMPFPTPEKLFRSLSSSWNNLLPQYQMDIETVIELAKKHMYIRAYELKTAEVDLGKSGVQVGFKGWMQLIVRDIEPIEQKWLPQLLLFGQIMNVGRFRTAGMGQIDVQKIDTLYHQDF